MYVIQRVPKWPVSEVRLNFIDHNNDISQCGSFTSCKCSRETNFISLFKFCWSQRLDRWRCIKRPDIKSHKIRSVAFRSRCIMTILDKLFIHQRESNSLYSISDINDTKLTKNGRLAPWISVIWLFEIPKCDSEKCYYYVFGYNTILYTFW
jgi:hypothetical protein